MTHSLDQNTPVYAAVNDVIAEVGAIKKNPMAGSIPFVGLDAAVERMRQIALDVPTVHAVPTEDSPNAALNAGQGKDVTGQSGSTVKS